MQADRRHGLNPAGPASGPVADRLDHLAGGGGVELLAESGVGLELLRIALHVPAVHELIDVKCVPLLLQGIVVVEESATAAVDDEPLAAKRRVEHDALRG